MIILITSNNFGKKPVSVNITTEFSVISVQQILNTIRVIVVVFETNSRHAKCMQRLSLISAASSREAKFKDPRENAMQQTISVSLVTGLDSLDSMSDTKEQDHMTPKSSFLSCDKILSHFEKGGGNFEFLLFCCHVRGRSWPRNLSFGPLLLVITSHD